MCANGEEQLNLLTLGLFLRQKVIKDFKALKIILISLIVLKCYILLDKGVNIDLYELLNEKAGIHCH